jgi:hypothetical protein
MNETIGAIKVFFCKEAVKNVFNLAQILTHNPLQVDFNTYLFCYFSQVGILLGKRSKHPYVDSKLF